ncbi:MAG: Rpn family recombination-promoting nuclease/putative transposase [Roseburia sp.]|nr:Rpn family recombination-promoting nuclease/putative transposase [Roseburia sp.]
MSKRTKEPNHKSYLEATGEIPYNMTNDYMFRAVLQKNEKVLRGLVAALLHLNPDEIQVEITNPIKLGSTIANKDFLLDVDVVLNRRTRLNLEMQVANEDNWTERSLSYLCRTFSEALSKGDEYAEIPSAIHISFIDFPLFTESPEFYATYMLQNIRNYHIYSDKLRLSVVELNRVSLATEEDRRYGIDYWAALFKARTWEEMKAMAVENEYLREAAHTIYEINSDRVIREQCIRRKEYDNQMKYYQRTIAEKNAEIAALKAQLHRQ